MQVGDFVRAHEAGILPAGEAAGQDAWVLHSDAHGGGSIEVSASGLVDILQLSKGQTLKNLRDRALEVEQERLERNVRLQRVMGALLNSVRVRVHSVGRWPRLHLARSRVAPQLQAVPQPDRATLGALISGDVSVIRQNAQLASPGPRTSQHSLAARASAASFLSGRRSTAPYMTAVDAVPASRQRALASASRLSNIGAIIDAGSSAAALPEAAASQLQHSTTTTGLRTPATQASGSGAALTSSVYASLLREVDLLVALSSDSRHDSRRKSVVAPSEHGGILKRLGPSRPPTPSRVSQRRTSQAYAGLIKRRSQVEYLGTQTSMQQQQQQLSAAASDADLLLPTLSQAEWAHLTRLDSSLESSKPISPRCPLHGQQPFSAFPAASTPQNAGPAAAPAKPGAMIRLAPISTASPLSPGQAGLGNTHSQVVLGEGRPLVPSALGPFHPRPSDADVLLTGWSPSASEWARAISSYDVAARTVPSVLHQQQDLAAPGNVQHSTAASALGARATGSSFKRPVHPRTSMLRLAPIASKHFHSGATTPAGQGDRHDAQFGLSPVQLHGASSAADELQTARSCISSKADWAAFATQPSDPARLCWQRNLSAHFAAVSPRPSALGVTRGIVKRVSSSYRSARISHSPKHAGRGYRQSTSMQRGSSNANGILWQQARLHARLQGKQSPLGNRLMRVMRAAVPNLVVRAQAPFLNGLAKVYATFLCTHTRPRPHRMLHAWEQLPT